MSFYIMTIPDKFYYVYCTYTRTRRKYKGNKHYLWKDIHDLRTKIFIIKHHLFCIPSYPQQCGIPRNDFRVFFWDSTTSVFSVILLVTRSHSNDSNHYLIWCPMVPTTLTHKDSLLQVLTKNRDIGVNTRPLKEQSDCSTIDESPSTRNSLCWKRHPV